MKNNYTRGVQILMQLGKYLAFNHDVHEIGTCIVYRWLCKLSIEIIHCAFDNC